LKSGVSGDLQILAEHLFASVPEKTIDAGVGLAALMELVVDAVFREAGKGIEQKQLARISSRSQML
jgi:hypothetical protein